MITTVLFDIGDTLLLAAARPGTPVDELVTEPLSDVVRTVRALANVYRLGTVADTSVMSSYDVRAALAGTGLDEVLEVIITSADVGAPTPHPRGIHAALLALDAEPSEALFVGDSDGDEGAATAAGVAFARVGPAYDLAGSVRRALTGIDGSFVAASALVAPIDLPAARRAREHHDRLTKPQGSLGRLEALGIQLAGIAGCDPPPVPRPAGIAVFAADHGVVVEGVTPWPQAVTAQMVANFLAGGAAINVLAQQAGALVTVVDVGVATDLAAHLDELARPRPSALVHRRIRAGTRNLATGPAMTIAEVRAALDVGADIAGQLVAGGAKALVTGEMGIGNTTASAAVIAAFTGRSPSSVTGRGTGVDDDTLRGKVDVIGRALRRIPAGAEPDVVLAEVGGLELAALVGFITAGASHRVPVVIDGVIACAALLAATALCPGVVAYVVAGHRSAEPGASAVLETLNLEPVLDLGLRLGEGTGACLALGVIEAAAHVLCDMATFDSAGVKADY